MYVWILVSEGIEIPCWEQYLPRGILRIRFWGSIATEKSLIAFATRFGIVIDGVATALPDMAIAFWNGTPDFVDATVEATAAERLVFLPNECGGGYSLL